MNLLISCVLLVILCRVATGEYSPCPLSTNERESEWKAWKVTYEKDYAEDEECERKAIWYTNLKKVERHNQLNLSYTLGMNHLADLTPVEYRALLLGFDGRHAQMSRNGSIFLPPSNVEYPTSVDWRTKGYVTPVKNQKQCGSCWAFSSTGSLEGQHFKKTGKLVSLSEQNLVDCSKRFGNNGCEGGLMDNAFSYIKANGGIDTEASYPYKAKDGRCRFEKSNVGATVSGFTDIAEDSETDLLKAAATVGPISVAIDASHTSFQLYNEGVYNEPDCSSIQLDHGVLVVGYGTYQGNDYWLVKNSWGPGWGLKGYIMMSRNKRNQCGIASKASYPLV